MCGQYVFIAVHIPVRIKWVAEQTDAHKMMEKPMKATAEIKKEEKTNKQPKTQ